MRHQHGDIRKFCCLNRDNQYKRTSEREPEGSNDKIQEVVGRSPGIERVMSCAGSRKRAQNERGALLGGDLGTVLHASYDVVRSGGGRSWESLRAI